MLFRISGQCFYRKGGSIQSVKDQWRLWSEYLLVMRITSDTEHFFKISARRWCFSASDLLASIQCRGLAKCSRRSRNIFICDMWNRLVFFRHVSRVFTNMEKTSGLRSGKYGSCGADGCSKPVVKLCTSLITTNQQALFHSHNYLPLCTLC